MIRLATLTLLTLASALPYLGSAFGIFLLRQTFRTVPQELDDAARQAAQQRQAAEAAANQ